MSIAEWREMPKGDYWIPELADTAYFARLRKDHSDKAAWTDEQLNDYFNENDQKYPTTWDHVGDANDDYEPLADAYFALRERLRDTAAMLESLETAVAYCMVLQGVIPNSVDDMRDAHAILKRLKEEGLL